MKLKEFFLKNRTCLETNKVFNQGNDRSDYVKFINHLKNLENITVENYYIKHVLNGIEPKCQCGCNLKTKYFKGEFNKYFSDHKNFTKPSKETTYKRKETKNNINNIENLLKKSGVTVNDIEKGYTDFINLKKPMSKISEELFIDFRTLKSYWFKLDLIKNKEIFNRFTLKSKSKWMTKVSFPKKEIINFLEENVLNIKLFIKDRDKVTFDELINYLNIKINKNYLSLFLRKNLSHDEVKKIKFIKVSQIEINFLNVLKFYFGNSVKSSFYLDGKIYDYKLGKKILIELDGIYWHSKEETLKNDKLKNKIAKENGYVLIRVNDTQVKNISFLNKVKKMYEKFK